MDKLRQLKELNTISELDKDELSKEETNVAIDLESILEESFDEYYYEEEEYDDTNAIMGRHKF